MEPGLGQGIQDKLQGILGKINREQLRNRVTDWQKKLVATASSRFSFDSSAPETLTTGPSVAVEEPDPPRATLSQNEKIVEETIIEELKESEEPGSRPDALREGIMEGEVLTETKLLSPVEEPPRNKSPVQQWVDSLIDVHERREEDMPPLGEGDNNDAEVESFTLGAEAPGVVCPRPYPFVQVSAHCGGSDAGSHCSSMESLLEARKPDPEEMLLELGFGGCEEPDIISRIPERFLRPSAMKGVVIDDFIKHQQLMVHQFQSGFSGYRGLTGPSHAMPSGIVGKIMDRLLEAEVERQNQAAYYQAQQQALLKNTAIQHCQASQTQGGYSPKLARLAHNLMVKMKGTKKELSVLSPENRNWYESQGDKSPEPAGRRIIIGHRSYTFATDGGLVEDPKGTANGGRRNDPGGTKRVLMEDRDLMKTEDDLKYESESTGSEESRRSSASKTMDSTRLSSRVLFEVEEEDEAEAVSSKDAETGETSVSISLQTDSVLTDTHPVSDRWPSSYSVITGEKTSEGASSLSLDRRESHPDVRPSIEKRRASLLEGRRLHEERRGSLEVDVCQCGRRMSDSSEPAFKRSRSPVPELVITTNLEQALGEDRTSVAVNSEKSSEREESFEKVDIPDISGSDCHPLEKRPSLTESEINDWMNVNDELSEDSAPPPRIDARRREGETLSLMEEMNLKPTDLPLFAGAASFDSVEVIAPSFSSLEERRISGASCSRSSSNDVASPTSSEPSTPSSHSFDREEVELEFKNLILLTTHLQDTVTDIGTEEEFFALDVKGRRNLQVAVLEEAFRTYQKRLKELDLRGHLKDLLNGQLHRVADLLDSTSAPSVPTIMKQMTTLLRHQEALREELELHDSRTKSTKRDS